MSLNTVEKALEVLHPIAEKLIGMDEPKPKKFQLNGQNLQLNYVPKYQFKVTQSTPAGEDFAFHSCLSIVQPGSQLPDTILYSAEEIASRRFHIYSLFGKKEIIIKSRSDTRPQFEGKGFGSALISVQDSLIRDLLRRFPELFTGYSVTAYLHDVAHKNSSLNPKQRTKWTSYWAERLGYQDQNPWKKVYQ